MGILGLKIMRVMGKLPHHVISGLFSFHLPKAARREVIILHLIKKMCLAYRLIRIVRVHMLKSSA